MFSRRAPGTETAALVGPAALLVALMVGVLLTRDVALGMAAVVGACYLPLALVNLRLGVVLWVPLTFLEGLPLFNAGGKIAGAILALAWLGAARDVGPRLSAFVGRHRAMVACLAGFMLWITLSLLWAESTSSVTADLWHWYVLGLIFLVLVTALGDASAVRMVLHAVVAGAVLSMFVGGLYGGLSPQTVDLQAAESGRLYGAAGDPNFLAAGLVPAIVIAAGLAIGTRSWSVRAWLLTAIGALVVGVAASESRGGLIALVLTLFVGLIFFRRRRAYVVLLLLLTLGVGGSWLASSPEAFQRVTTFNDQGSGRSDIWRVALRVGEAHPVTGAGLANFADVSKDYVRRPGGLKSLALVVDRPHVAHNLYLELWSDVGVIGLLLFLGFAGACVVAAWKAGMHFEREGDEELEVLARAILVATISFLIASVFISAGEDKRLWILLALGPAIYGLAFRRAPARRAAMPAPPSPPPPREPALVG